MADQDSNKDIAKEDRSAVEQLVATKAYVDNPELLPWYTKEVEGPEPDVRELFENYSKVPSADVTGHIKHVRDEAFKIYPYPCLGGFGFLNFSIGKGPAYQEVLKRIKDGEQFLDLGCCMGQDIRKLVHDSAPSENTFASDIKKNFWDLGYDMFLDKSSLKTKFLEADIFDADSQLQQLDGKIDIVNTASFFHLFELEDQIKAAKRVVRLLRPVPNVLVVGRQAAKAEPGNHAHLTKGQIFWHNVESWKDMWEQVGRETGTKWHVDAVLGGEPSIAKKEMASFIPAGTRYMTFSIRRE